MKGPIGGMKKSEYKLNKWKKDQAKVRQVNMKRY